jgi:hypothetical protein
MRLHREGYDFLLVLAKNPEYFLLISSAPLLPQCGHLIAGGPQILFLEMCRVNSLLQSLPAYSYAGMMNLLVSEF